MTILNTLINHKALEEEKEFLDTILSREQLKLILYSKTINISLRAELLDYYRKCYLEVILDKKDINYYTSILINDFKYEILDVNKDSIFFAFRIEDYDAHFIDVSNILYFKIYYYSTEQGKNGEYHSIIKDEFLPYHICNDSDFPDVNLTKTYVLKFFDEKKILVRKK